MSTRAIAADGEVVVNTDSYVSSNLAFGVTVAFPKINDGTGATVAVGKTIRVEALGAAPIKVLGNTGRLIQSVPGRRSVVFVAKAGTVESEVDSWQTFSQTAVPTAFVADAPAGGVGAAAGGWDTAAHRDTAIATINACKAALVGLGAMKAE